MFVLHTTIAEVYERLWVVHEADLCVDAKLQLRGLFDLYRWTGVHVNNFNSAPAVRTRKGKCGVPEDEAYIAGLVRDRGGHDRLDGVIAEVRWKMLGELKDNLIRYGQDSDQ